MSGGTVDSPYLSKGMTGKNLTLTIIIIIIIIIIIVAVVYR